METMKANSKILRIKEIMNDVNARSVRAFALSVGLSQSSMATTLSGDKDPSHAMMVAIVRAYPQYSLKWLEDGEGDMYKGIDDEEDSIIIDAQERTLSDRVKRIKEVFEESGIRSVRAFALDMGQSQSTFASYFTGSREPSNEIIRIIIKHYPIYNFDWLAYGKGDKFKPTYVDVRDDSNYTPPQRIPIKEPEPAEKNDLSEKLNAIYEKLVFYMERCSKLEKELREMQEKKQS